METPEERRNDPAWQAVDEGGGGEEEGFELAEEQLIENAENAEHSSALDEGIPDNAEEEFAGAAYGDADEIVKSSEVVSEEGVPPEGDTSS
jgi:hypothetical protein